MKPSLMIAITFMDCGQDYVLIMAEHAMSLKHQSPILKSPSRSRQIRPNKRYNDLKNENEEKRAEEEKIREELYVALSRLTELERMARAGTSAPEVAQTG